MFFFLFENPMDAECNQKGPIGHWEGPFQAHVGAGYRGHSLVQNSEPFMTGFDCTQSDTKEGQV